jgi:hypothetical protein
MSTEGGAADRASMQFAQKISQNLQTIININSHKFPSGTGEGLDRGPIILPCRTTVQRGQYAAIAARAAAVSHIA